MRNKGRANFSEMPAIRRQITSYGTKARDVYCCCYRPFIFVHSFSLLWGCRWAAVLGKRFVACSRIITPNLVRSSWFVCIRILLSPLSLFPDEVHYVPALILHFPELLIHIRGRTEAATHEEEEEEDEAHVKVEFGEFDSKFLLIVLSWLWANFS